jgi:ubiquinone biosynthesis protein
MLGPTYIKLGTDHGDPRGPAAARGHHRARRTSSTALPPFPFPQVRAIIEQGLQRPVEERVREHRSAAARLGLHRAGAPGRDCLDGTPVVVKVIKPGIREVIESDLKLLQIVGVFLQWVIPRYQPRQIIREFSAYTIKEVDYTFEADNAEIFAANFRDMPEVVFPRIYRELSSPTC